MGRSEDASLDDLVEALLKEPRYSTGELPAPRSVAVGEALIVLGDIYAGTEEADRHLPALAESLAREIACHKGCPGKCCESLVLVSLPEAIRIAEELDRPERQEERERFLARVGAWLETAGERAQRAADALAAGDTNRYVQFMRDHGLSHAMCPFSTNDVCDIHGVRPLPCRQAWVLDTWKSCRASEKPDVPLASILTSRPHEDLYARSKRVLAGLQNAMRGGVQRVPLPLAVFEILTRPKESGDYANSFSRQGTS